jgi:hypothetical protein
MMCLPLHRNQRGQSLLTTWLDVGLGEVPRVRDQVDRLPQFDQQGLELREDGCHLLCVMARLHGVGGHAQYTVRVYRNLTVVALIKSATGYVHDAGGFVGQLDLVFLLCARYRWSRHLAARGRVAFLRFGCTRIQLGLVVGLLRIEPVFGMLFDRDCSSGDGREPGFTAGDLFRQVEAIRSRRVVRCRSDCYELLDVAR